MKAKLKKRSAYIWIMVIVMGLIGITFVMPFAYMFINSVKTKIEYFKSPLGLPQGELQWQTYKVMIGNFKIFQYFKNTVIVVILTDIIVLPVSIFTSYTFAKYYFKGKNALYLTMIASMTIPSQVMVVPIYVYFGKLNLLNTFSGMVIANMALIASCVVMMTAFFKSIPNELIESAKLDGCGYFRTVLHIVVPIGKPIIIIEFILKSINLWNDLFMPKILLQKNSVKLIMPALADLVDRYTAEPTYLMAGMLLSVIPTLLLFIFFQKYIIKGILAGSIKG